MGKIEILVINQEQVGAMNLLDCQQLMRLQIECATKVGAIPLNMRLQVFSPEAEVKRYALPLDEPIFFVQKPAAS